MKNAFFLALILVCSLSRAQNLTLTDLTLLFEKDSEEITLYLQSKDIEWNFQTENEDSKYWGKTENLIEASKTDEILIYYAIDLASIKSFLDSSKSYKLIQSGYVPEALSSGMYKNDQFLAEVVTTATIGYLRLARIRKQAEDVGRSDGVEVDDVFETVEQMPRFQGGDEALKKYIAKNIKYPLKEKESGISGTVKVSFVVDTQGKVKDAKVERGIPNGENLETEALRLITEMPNWAPGKQNGNPVNVFMTVPIRFQLR